MSLGRTGTAFIANLLSQAQGARVLHEQFPDDRTYFGLRYYGTMDISIDRYLHERFQLLMAQDPSILIYGEVNSYLRYEIEWLKIHLDPVLIHLVRDGRDFARSAMKRDTYTPYDRQIQIIPKDNDAYAERWHKMDRFQKICWYWMHTNEFIANGIGTGHYVKFENIVTNHSYFKHNILNKVGLDIDSKTWKEHIDKPRNISEHFIKKKIKYFLKSGGNKVEKKNFLPHHSKWHSEFQDKFDEICAGTMAKFGYY